MHRNYERYITTWFRFGLQLQCAGDIFTSMPFQSLPLFTRLYLFVTIVTCRHLLFVFLGCRSMAVLTALKSLFYLRFQESWTRLWIQVSRLYEIFYKSAALSLHIPLSPKRLFLWLITSITSSCVIIQVILVINDRSLDLNPRPETLSHLHWKRKFVSNIRYFWEYVQFF